MEETFIDTNGKDNYGKPKQEYLDELADMTDAELRKQCNQMIWLSAYAGNNPRSDFHWQCDACYDECSRRDKVSIYEQEHDKLVRGANKNKYKVKGGPNGI